MVSASNLNAMLSSVGGPCFGAVILFLPQLTAVVSDVVASAVPAAHVFVMVSQRFASLRFASVIPQSFSNRCHVFSAAMSGGRDRDTEARKTAIKTLFSRVLSPVYTSFAGPKCVAEVDPTFVALSSRSSCVGQPVSLRRVR